MDNITLLHAFKELLEKITELEEKIYRLEDEDFDRDDWFIDHELRINKMEGIINKNNGVDSHKPFKCPVCYGRVFLSDGELCKSCNENGVVWS